MQRTDVGRSGPVGAIHDVLEAIPGWSTGTAARSRGGPDGCIGRARRAVRPVHGRGAALVQPFCGLQHLSISGDARQRRYGRVASSSGRAACAAWLKGAMRAVLLVRVHVPIEEWLPLGQMRDSIRCCKMISANQGGSHVVRGSSRDAERRGGRPPAGHQPTAPPSAVSSPRSG